jgi:hypothetical protein
VTLLDVEWDSELNQQRGAEPMPRPDFLAMLARGGDPVRPADGTEEARRLGFLDP